MNLMEGAMRLGSKEYRQFVGIARGSAGEVCYQLLLARDLQYISSDTYQELRTGYDRVIQMLSRLSQSLSRRTTPTITVVLLRPDHNRGSSFTSHDSRPRARYFPRPRLLSGHDHVFSPPHGHESRQFSPTISHFPQSPDQHETRTRVTSVFLANGFIRLTRVASRLMPI